MIIFFALSNKIVFLTWENKGFMEKIVKIKLWNIIWNFINEKLCGMAS